MKYLFGILMICSVMFVSCGDDEPEVNCTITNFNTSINAAIDELNAAITVFNDENSVENCDAVKDAANAYIEAVEDFEGCAEISAEVYDDALQSANAALATIIC